MCLRLNRDYSVLRKFPHLTDLSLVNATIGSYQIEAIVLHCKNLRKLGLNNRIEPFVNLSLLCGLKSLTSLAVCNSSSLCDVHALDIIKLDNHLKNLCVGWCAPSVLELLAENLFHLEIFQIRAISAHGYSKYFEVLSRSTSFPGLKLFKAVIVEAGTCMAGRIEEFSGSLSRFRVDIDYHMMFMASQNDVCDPYCGCT